MPTVMRIGPCRFFFYSNEQGEPPHIHIQREVALAKFWLEPVALASSRNFAAHELNVVRRLVEEHAEKLMEAWRGHHGN